ncbi:MAG: RpiB/LacA/LacB family sugar-phosphate isomerase, partial [Chloroflexota bacterium]
MKLAVGTDERNHVVDFVLAELKKRGYQVNYTGPQSGQNPPVSENYWPSVARRVAQAVAGGDADEGILFCWTGTGVSLAANKVRGIRAALCVDAETARGARLWNNANILCLSLRLTTEATAREILTAWFGTAYQPNETDNT